MATSALTRVDSHYAPTYKDLTLPECQTRVLRLLPGGPGAAVRAELITIDLDDPSHTKYDAISYVWSLLSGTSNLEIDGKPCTVPASAEDVLRNIRYRDSPRIVWIDAICINQGNIVEKQHQVSIMGSIYAKAERTLIWLGAESTSTALAFKTLRTIHEQASHVSDGCERLRDVLYGKAQIFQYSTTPLPASCTAGAMDAVRELFRCPWFKRRWIIQEAALPPEGIVCWGAQSMPVLELFRAAVWMHHKEDHLGFDIQQEGGMLNASYMSAHVDRDQGWFSPKHGQRQKLADLFRYFQTFDASVDHDRVYALLGLTKWHFEQKPLPKSITPDYDKNINEVLADATRIATEEAGDLWLFRYVDLAETLHPEGPPSWVPQLFRGVDPDVDPNHLRSTFNASKGMVDGYSDLIQTVDLNPKGEDWRTISAEGFSIDRIQDVSKAISKQKLAITGKIYDLFAEVTMSWLNEEDYGRDAAFLALEPYERSLVLLAGTHFDPEPSVAQNEPVGTFEQFINAFCAVSRDQNKAEALLEDKASARYIRALRWAATNRRFFTTDDGRFGIGSRATRQGDILVVLSASRMPMVMRPSGEKWQVVGPCYVHGIMKGEAVEAWKASGDAPMAFLLH